MNRKGLGREATLADLGHVLLDNRHGLVANVCVARRLGPLNARPRLGRSTGAGRRAARSGPTTATTSRPLSTEVRALDVTPHIARKSTCSAIYVWTTFQRGYGPCQQERTLVEQVFGWLKTMGGLWSAPRQRGALVAAAFNSGATADLGGHVFLTAWIGGGPASRMQTASVAVGQVLN